MGVVGEIVLLIAVLVALAATVAVYPALWRAYGDQWRRIPPERRSRARVALGLALLTCIVVGALLILEPWGPHTVVWIALVGGGAVVVLVPACVAAQAMLDARRARGHRTQDT
jgi:Na+/H+ antiporter NhaD/arsenite permease-like protein